MLLTPSINCSNEPQPRPLTVGIVDYYVQHYVFPIQFIFGVVGNSINLLVLLSSSIKNQTNTLLSAMALADIGFLFCMLPHSLVSFSVFYRSVHFSYMYFLTKTHAVALANMFSTAASFLVLAVSLERLSGVRKPMHSRFQLRDGARIICLIFSVFVLSFLLSFYHHVEYHVNLNIKCNTVVPYFQHISQIVNSPAVLTRYVCYAKYTQSIVGVVLPVIVVFLLNVSLICILRKREILSRTVTDKSKLDFRYSDIGALQRQEKKVTATVIAIITCFSVTHLPTLFPFIWQQFYSYRGMKLTVSTFNNTITLFNMLLVSGKVLNFVLFCLSSAHFRRRTMMILSTYLCQEPYHKKYSNMITSAAVQGTVPFPLGNAIIGSSSELIVATPLNNVCHADKNGSINCLNICAFFSNNNNNHHSLHHNPHANHGYYNFQSNGIVSRKKSFAVSSRLTSSKTTSLKTTSPLITAANSATKNLISSSQLNKTSTAGTSLPIPHTYIFPFKVRRYEICKNTNAALRLISPPNAPLVD